MRRTSSLPAPRKVAQTPMHRGLRLFWVEREKSRRPGKGAALPYPLACLWHGAQQVLQRGGPFLPGLVSRGERSSVRVIPRSPPFLVADGEETRIALKMPVPKAPWSAAARLPPFLASSIPTSRPSKALPLSTSPVLTAERRRRSAPAHRAPGRYAHFHGFWAPVSRRA